jgi:hypothetical protein
MNMNLKSGIIVVGASLLFMSTLQAEPMSTQQYVEAQSLALNDVNPGPNQRSASSAQTQAVPQKNPQLAEIQSPLDERYQGPNSSSPQPVDQPPVPPTPPVDNNTQQPPVNLPYQSQSLKGGNIQGAPQNKIQAQNQPVINKPSQINPQSYPQGNVTTAPAPLTNQVATNNVNANVPNAANQPPPINNGNVANAQPQPVANNTNGNPQPPAPMAKVAIPQEAKAAWVQNCMKSVTTKPASDYASEFCSCGLSHIENGELPVALLMDPSPQAAQQRSSILHFIANQCRVDLYTKHNL